MLPPFSRWLRLYFGAAGASGPAPPGKGRGFYRRQLRSNRWGRSREGLEQDSGEQPFADSEELRGADHAGA